MYKGDRTRKEMLVDFGFRLPSALDNRPLTFEEFEEHLNQAIYVSATPGPYELEQSERVVEQLDPPDGHHRPADRRSARPRARSTTCSRRSAAGSSAASGRWSRR